MTDTLSLGFVSNTGRPSRNGPVPRKKQNVVSNRVETAPQERSEKTAWESRRIKKPRVSQLLSSAPAPPPKENNLVAQKTEFLEQSAKKHQSSIDQLTGVIQNTNDGIEEKTRNLTWDIETLFEVTNVIYGKTLQETPFFIADYDDDLNTCLETKTTDEYLPEGRWLQLVYPMAKQDTKIFMKAKMVNKETGQLYWAWVLLKDEHNRDKIKYIGEFATYPNI